MYILILLTIIILVMIVCDTIEKIFIYHSYKSLTPEQIEAFVRNAKR